MGRDLRSYLCVWYYHNLKVKTYYFYVYFFHRSISEFSYLTVEQRKERHLVTFVAQNVHSRHLTFISVDALPLQLSTTCWIKHWTLMLHFFSWIYNTHGDQFPFCKTNGLTKLGKFSKKLENEFWEWLFNMFKPTLCYDAFWSMPSHLKYIEVCKENFEAGGHKGPLCNGNFSKDKMYYTFEFLMSWQCWHFFVSIREWLSFWVCDILFFKYQKKVFSSKLRSRK